MFTPYGNHGLGDSARIPISYTKEINNINWTKYGILKGIKTNDENEVELTHFKIKNNNNTIAINWMNGKFIFLD